MKHATSVALYTHWQSCQGRAGVRAGFMQAVELAPILPFLFLLDAAPFGDPSFRFCGTAVSVRFGRDLAGEDFLALWNSTDRDLLDDDLRTMGSQSSGLVAGTMAETVGGGYTQFEMLLLPLSGDDGMAGVIGSMARTGGHEETNRIRARIVGQSLQSVRFLPAPEARIKREPVPAGRIGWQASHRLPRRSAHLTLVAGGKQADLPDLARTVTDP